MWCKYVMVALAMAVYVDAYSSGAPESACVDMIPRHPVSPQATPAPYIITTSSKTVKAGNSIEVVISGKEPSNTIGGLLLQARQGDKPVGTFTVQSNDPFAKLLNCGSPGNAVTHKKHELSAEKQTVKFLWTAPKDFDDEIKFRATVAHNGAVFWVGLESAPIKVTI